MKDKTVKKKDRFGYKNSKGLEKTNTKKKSDKDK